MIPTELLLALDFRSGGDPACLSHWLKAYDAPHLLREGDFVNDNVAPEREELLAVTGTQYNVGSGRLTALLESPEPANLDEYLDRMAELAAGGWHQLEDPFVYDNPLPPVGFGGWQVEWRLRLVSTLPAPVGGSCWTKKTSEREVPYSTFWSPVNFGGLLGEGEDAPELQVLTVCRASGKLEAVAEVCIASKDTESVSIELLTATGWQPLPDDVRRRTSLIMEEYPNRTKEADAKEGD